MIKMTYTENNGKPIHMEFPTGAELIIQVAKLLALRYQGVIIFVSSFVGPIGLGKMVYNYLSEELT